MTVSEDLPLRCSAFARDVGLNPVGTAGSYDGFLLVEHPLPWPRDVSEDPILSQLIDPARSTRYRLQALVPAANADSTRTVIHYRRPSGNFRQYVSSRHLVPTEALVDTCRQLTASDAALAEPAGRHVLVCGHGRRDRCCGSMGTALAVAMATAAPPRTDDVALWRTSHTGGHRFAPTAVIFPEGTMWAYLDAETLAGIVDRTAPITEAAARYRGCAGLDGPEVQALDGAVFAERGWDWLDCARSGAVLESDGGSSRVRLEYESPDGESGVYEGDVMVRRVVPVPDCGKPIVEAKKSEPEFQVTSLTGER